MISITGYIVPPKKGEKEESGDEEDDGVDFPDFDEMSAVAGGGSFINSYPGKRKTVTIKSLERGSSERCEGKLLLSEPWWLLTASIYKRRGVSDIRSVSYQLRQDDKQGEHKLVTMFLLQTSRNDPLVEEFVKFLETNKQPKEITFARLDDDLRHYMKVTGFYHEDGRRLKLLSAIWTQKQGKCVRFAMDYPHLFNITSKLLPGRFLSLAENVDGKLRDLEEATGDSIWELGFKQILRRKYSLCGIEAEMPAWQSSNLIADIGPLYKDALYIYNALKLISKQENHSYVPQARLKRNEPKYFYQYSVTNWVQALKFLETNDVIVREVETGCQIADGTTKVYLASNFYAEVNAAKALANVAYDTTGPEYWEVDLDSEDFAQIRTDEDQLKAVGQMNLLSLSVLSGKGGCGKTSVVTTLLSHACIKSFQARHPGRSLKSLVIKQRLNPPTEEKLKPRPSEMQSTEDEGSKEPEREKYEDDGNQEIEDTFLSETPLGEHILLTAPTGKAASLLGRKAKLKSCTLHSVIMSYKMYCVEKKRKRKLDEAQSAVRDFECYRRHHDNHQMMQYLDALATLRDEERRNERRGNSFDDSSRELSWTHSSKSVLVVDECSLVSVNTFATMMNILMKEANIKKIILLGDVRQLPSIEPGNFLSDIFKVFSDRGLGLELRTNHRAESELIVNNATLISQGQYPVFDSQRKFSLIEPEDGTDKAREDAVKKLLNTEEELKDHTTSQFVTFTRKVVGAVNEMCCKHYTNTSLMEPGKRFKTLFKEGDKICLCRNGTVFHHYVRMIKKNKNDVNAEVEVQKKNTVDSNHGEDNNTTNVGRKTTRTNIAVKRNLSIDFQNGGTQAAAGSCGDSVLSASNGDRSMSGKHGDSNIPGYQGDRVEDCHGDTVEMVEFSERGDQLCGSVDMIPFEHFTDLADESQHHKIGSNSPCKNKQNHTGLQDVLERSSHLKTTGKLSLKKDGSMSVRYRESQHYMESASTSGRCTTSPSATASAAATSTATSSSSTTASTSGTCSTSTATSSSSATALTSRTGSISATATPSEASASATTSAKGQQEGSPLRAEDFSVRSLVRLCATRRDRARREDVDPKTDKFRIEHRKVKLSNGEIFFIEKDFNYTSPNNHVTRFLYINDRDPEKPRRFCVDFKEVMTECKMRHAWTRTIHTFQGSESEVVVYILGNIFYENWQHVYTAITRGRQSVYVVGNNDALRRTIQRPASKRNTTLQEKLVQKLEDAKEIRDNKKAEENNDIKDANTIDNIENNNGTIALDKTEGNPESLTRIKDLPMDTRGPHPSTSAKDHLDISDPTPNKKSCLHGTKEGVPCGLGSLLTSKIISGPQATTRLKSDLPSARGSSLKKRKSWETFGNKDTPMKSRKTGGTLSVTPVRKSIDGMSLDNQNSDDDFL